MFRVPTAAAAAITDRTTDTFSVLDTHTAPGTGLRIAAEAEATAAIRRVAWPAEPPRPRHRREARITTPRPTRTDRRTATSSGYRPR